METKDIIVGLFFSDNNDLICDEINFSENIGEEKKNELKMLSFKFLGPVFLTAASEEGNDWKIDFIESSLSLYKFKVNEIDLLQSFFSINSSIKSVDGMIYLFALIGSPYTKDIKILRDEITECNHLSFYKIITKNKLVV